MNEPQTRADDFIEETPEDDLAAFEDDVETVDVDDQFPEYEDEDEDEEPSYEETPSLAVDEALEQLRVDNPAQYNALKGLQAGYSKWQDFSDEVEETRALQQELKDTLENLSAEETEGVDDGEVAYTTKSGIRIPEFPEGHELHGISDEQWDLTLAMMDQLGVKPADQIAAEAEQKAMAESTKAAQDEYVLAEAEDAIESFGESFGEVIDGQLVLTEEAQAAISPIHQRLYDPKRGISAQDLYVLKLYQQGELLTKDRAAELQEEEGAEQEERVVRRRRAEVVTRAPVGRRRPVIYDPKKGDTLQDAIKKAGAAALREIRVPRR